MFVHPEDALPCVGTTRMKKCNLRIRVSKRKNLRQEARCAGRASRCIGGALIGTGALSSPFDSGFSAERPPKGHPGATRLLPEVIAL